MMSFRGLLLTCVLGLLAGCADKGPKRVPISGTVEMDGQPMAHGTLYFVEPSSGKPPEAYEVTDGKFSGMALLGQKRVEIASAQQVARKPGEVPMGPPPTFNVVHDDYNANSKLTAEVTDQGLSPSTFSVKSNRKGK